MDLKEQVLSYDMIFIKEDLLYLPNNIVLAPREKNMLERRELADVSQRELPDDIKKTKTSFLVFKHQKYTTVKTNDIAFFFIRNETVSMMCFDEQEYSLNQSLDQIMNSVSSSQFFRVNRKYLINFKAIKEVEHYFLRKLFVRLLMDTPDKLLINKEKTNVFLSWMGDR